MENQIQEIRSVSLVGYQQEILKKSTIVESSLSKLEREVVQAVTAGEIICAVHMRNPEEAQEKFKTVIKRCAALCSVKTAPDEYTLSFLYKYLTQSCGNSTFEEVEKACYFNQSGQFGDRINHYDAFDVNFLSQVMEQWLIVKTKTRQRIAALLPPPPPPVEQTPQECYNGLVEYLKKNAGEFPEFWSWGKVFLHMDEQLMIEMSEEQRYDFRDQVSDELEKNLELRAFNMPAKEYQRELSEMLDTVKSECRKRLVKKFIRWE